MKKSISFLLFCLITTIGFSQNFTYSIPGVYPSSTPNEILRESKLNCMVRGAYIRPIKKEVLMKATLMREIYEHYPSAWIEDYISTEITVTYKGKTINAMGTDEKLTMVQKSILQHADFNTKILIDVRYRAKNSVTNKEEIRKMNYTLTVIPEVEAVFTEGDPSEFVKKKIEERIAKGEFKKFNKGAIRFTIDEKGEIKNVKMVEYSESPETDQFLLEIINEMPKWKAAKNIKGIAVEQDFELLTGYMFGGC